MNNNFESYLFVKDKILKVSQKKKDNKKYPLNLKVSFWTQNPPKEQEKPASTCVLCLQSGWNQLYLKRYENIIFDKPKEIWEHIPCYQQICIFLKKQQQQICIGFHKNWMPTMQL